MDMTNLIKKRDLYHANKHNIPKAVSDNYDTAFEVDFTHNSTAIEGNTLSAMEVKLLLEINAAGGDLGDMIAALERVRLDRNANKSEVEH